MISACVSLGYSIEACVKTQQKNAYYAVARSLSLFIVAIVTLIYHNIDIIITMSILMISSLFIDCLIVWKYRQHFKTIGPIATAIFHLLLLLIFLF
ncbi:hypothetical protein [Staphylococcus simiae]|uniref:hypothetical protein n=1 Tax=Staphylococcus simiae TaxID=308354 RepID=UPI001F613D84|nr:hypothetical protein [Staphylococcus simiae]